MAPRKLPPDGTADRMSDRQSSALDGFRVNRTGLICSYPVPNATVIAEPPRSVRRAAARSTAADCPPRMSHLPANEPAEGTASTAVQVSRVIQESYGAAAWARPLREGTGPIGVAAGVTACQSRSPCQG